MRKTTKKKPNARQLKKAEAQRLADLRAMQKHEAEKRLAEFNNIRAFVGKFLEDMTARGYIASIQFAKRAERFGPTHVSTMNLSEVLGALDVAKEITVSGLRQGQAFDSLVQSVEQRPDLAKRLHKAMSPCRH